MKCQGKATWIRAILAFILVGLLSTCGTINPRVDDLQSTQGAVIEIVTFKLKSGVALDDFRPLDRSVEEQHVTKQPGFISRESASSDSGEWLVIVHWRSLEDAEASMANFVSAPATEEFMSKIDMKSMTMKRYIVSE